MPKYSDKPCARCGKMMLHAYCSQRYCKACASLVRSDDAIISRAKQRSKRAMSEIARVERAARAEGKTYGCYVALHEPRKGDAMTYEEKVAWLRRYQQSLRQERELEQELLTLRSQACRVTPLLSAMPTGTPDGQGIPRAVERIIQAQQELERQIAICADTRRDIITIINQITDARDQEILRRRYLLGQSFEQIAVEMHLEYRWVRRVHKKIVSELQI